MANLDLGDRGFQHADTVTLDSDGTGSAGDFVTFNASGQVTPVAVADDDVIGVLSEDSPASAGEKVAVHVQGAVLANVANAVVAGDVLEPDGTNAGRCTANAQGSYHAVNEGGTATYSLAMDHPRALEDAGTDNAALVKLP